jgi:hypothetical protein
MCISIAGLEELVAYNRAHAARTAAPPSTPPLPEKVRVQLQSAFVIEVDAIAERAAMIARELLVDRLINGKVLAMQAFIEEAMLVQPRWIVQKIFIDEWSDVLIKPVKAERPRRIPGWWKTKEPAVRWEDCAWAPPGVTRRSPVGPRVDFKLETESPLTLAA